MSILSIPATSAACLLLLSMGSVGPSAYGRQEDALSRDSLTQVAGRALLEARYELAIRLLSPIRPDSLSGRAHFILGSSYAALNDVEQSLRSLRKSVERDTTNAGYRFQLARVLLLAGLTREAEGQYLTILRNDTSFTAALFSLGRIALDRKDFPVALLYFEAVIRQNPRDYLSLYHIGECYERIDSVDLARSFLSASLTLNRRHAPTLTLLGSLYYRQSDYREALRLYRQASREFPDRAEYWYYQGLCLEKFEDWRGARDCHREATRLDSSSSLYFAHLGQVYFELTRFDSSARSYERAVRLDEENPVLLLNLGLAYARARLYPEAESAMKKSILAHEPEQVAKSYVQLAALYFTQERIRDARTAYERALVFQPENREALFYRAVTLDRLQQYKQARTAYQRYLTVAGDDASQQERVKAAKARIEVIAR